LKKYTISNLENFNKIYFSEDGIHFSEANSIVLYPWEKNVFEADPEHYFLFRSEMLEGDEMVGDGEIPAKYSDWHERVYLDGKEYYIANQVMFRKFKNYF